MSTTVGSWAGAFKLPRKAHLGQLRRQGVGGIGPKSRDELPTSRQHGLLSLVDERIGDLSTVDPL